jgi:hypothetical protein
MTDDRRSTNVRGRFNLSADDSPMPDTVSRCEAVPLAHQQVSLRIDGVERTRWQFSDDHPRPCFFPLLGPESSESLTRMGHPGAPNHDHHQSVWFAHNKVLGIDFWGNDGPARIRQREWRVYEDGEADAKMAVLLDWLDGHDPQPLIEQELVTVLRPLEGGEYTLELHSTFRPHSEQIEFQQTNFGFLAVRVARGLSAVFGGGRLTSSKGAVGEPAIFGSAARWVDYSGPIAFQRDGALQRTEEGITYFDHPTNRGYPNSWHVRDDGWMACSPCLRGPLTATRNQPLVLRFLLHVHRGPVNPARAEVIAAQFASRSGYHVVKSMRPHHQFEIDSP